MASSEDFGKYYCALGSRSIRRVAAHLVTTSEFDPDVRIAKLGELTEALMWQRAAALPVRPPEDRLTEDNDARRVPSRPTWRFTPTGSRCSPWSIGWMATPPS